MRTVNRNIWLPSIFEGLFLENKLDVPNNYETFSRPAINVTENLATFVLELAAPGLNKGDFVIEVEENTLKISSKKSADKEKNEKTEDSTILKKEFDYEGFERLFKLPEDIETDSIEAAYENGILKVTLPKMEVKKVLKKMVEIS